MSRGFSFPFHYDEQNGKASGEKFYDSVLLLMVMVGDKKGGQQRAKGMKQKLRRETIDMQAECSVVGGTITVQGFLPPVGRISSPASAFRSPYFGYNT